MSARFPVDDRKRWMKTKTLRNTIPTQKITAPMTLYKRLTKNQFADDD